MQNLWGVPYLPVVIDLYYAHVPLSILSCLIILFDLIFYLIRFYYQILPDLISSHLILSYLVSSYLVYVVGSFFLYSTDLPYFIYLYLILSPYTSSAQSKVKASAAAAAAGAGTKPAPATVPARLKPVVKARHWSILMGNVEKTHEKKQQQT